MKRTDPAQRVVIRIAMRAAIAVIGGWVLIVPSLRAADQTEQQAVSILTTGQWRIMGAGPPVVRTFKGDGTFTSDDHSTGTWKLSGGVMELTFPGGTAEQKFYLPIDLMMNRGLDENGAMLMMVRAMPGGAQGHRPIGNGAATPPEVQLPHPGTPQGAIQGFPGYHGATPAGTPATDPEVQQGASRLIQTYHDSLVFVNGKEGAGSGFIATIGKATYLVTNAHVEAGIRDASFKTLDGAEVQGGAASSAIGEDIFCIEIPGVAKPFEIMQGVDTNAAVGDDVVVLGNAEGAGVVNTIIGKIVGIGPELVEIDAPFVPGNSGSPIVHLKTGKVVGVATYTVANNYDLTTNQKLKEPVIRRFGYRLDSVKLWQPVRWTAFNAQAAQVQAVEKLTDDLYDFFRDLAENKGHVTAGRHTNPVIKSRIDDWTEAKGHNHSVVDMEEADANLISFLKVACESDVAAAQRQLTYDYFQRKLAEQKEIRDEMEKAFTEILNRVQE
jgi:hypothetical protein